MVKSWVDLEKMGLDCVRFLVVVGIYSISKRVLSCNVYVVMLMMIQSFKEGFDYVAYKRMA